jgi:hypothetical protein
MSSGLRHALAQGCHVVPTLLCTGLLLVTWHLMAPRLVHRPMRLVFVSEATANQGEDIATFMIRNAYHFSTLYHAARAEQWALAAYEAEELEETLEDAARASPTYRLLLQQYRQDFVPPLRRALAARDATQFRTAFGAAVQGCNNCHVATQHPFITIPPEPPPLSIFVLPSIGR